jgi:hypothetical protein
MIITTKLQEAEEDDDDEKDNAGFEKLSGEGNRIGRLVLKLREGVVRVIVKQKVRHDFHRQSPRFVLNRYRQSRRTP